VTLERNGHCAVSDVFKFEQLQEAVFRPELRQNKESKQRVEFQE
jgi:hypothetical protein